MYRLDPPPLPAENLFSPSTAGWKARLDVVLAHKSDKTIVEQVSHEGPLRIQRPFYPEGEGISHLYLLHPPGGMVTGDALNVCVTLKNNAKALVTTPSAGKIYRGDGSLRQQYQSVDLRLQPGAVLEWLPQETIIYNGARGEVSTVLQLEPGSRVLCWDVVCLGRPASDEIFTSGHLVQKLLLRRGDKTLYRERNFFVGGSELLSQPWGMRGHPVSGTCIATCVLEESVLTLLRENLAATVQEGMMAISQIDQCLLVRYVGPSVEECRRGFEIVRAVVRPLLNVGLVASGTARPRIRNT